MLLKKGITLQGIKAETIICMYIADSIAKQRFNREITITSLNDGKHMPNSKHYQGYAFDIRTYDWKIQSELQTYIELLKKDLDFMCDIVLEKDHIHIEYDPK